MRWRVILPTPGLLLFALEIYDSNRDCKIPASRSRYIWWACIRLDSDPMNRDPRSRDANAENRARSDGPLKIVDPGYLVLASMVITTALSRFGVSQVWTFMFSTPILLLCLVLLSGVAPRPMAPKIFACNC